MVVPMTFKHLFGLATMAWVLLWLVSAVTIGGLMGDSVTQLLAFVGMAFVPPTLLYLLLFRMLPRMLGRFRKSATQL